MQIYGIAGLLMIFLFLSVVYYLKNNSLGKTIKKITLSEISSHPEYTIKVKMIVFSAALCGVIFTIGAVQFLGIGIGSLTFVAGIYGSIAMFLTGLSIHTPDSNIHNISSLFFYFCLLVLPLDTSFLLINSGNVLFGVILFYLCISCSIVSIVILINEGLTKNHKMRKIKANGIQEIIVMAPSAIWVVVISILMLFNLQ